MDISLHGRHPKGKEIGKTSGTEAREDWMQEDCSRGRLQGHYCFLYSALQLTMQNPLNGGMSGCQNYPIRVTPLLS